MKIVVIDGNCIAHKCRFTNSVLFKGVETGVVHQLLETALNLGTVFKTRNVVFVFDSKHSLRKRKCPWYKQRRDKRKKELGQSEKKALLSVYRQIDESRRLLTDMGFSVFLQNGKEGDDLIASIVNNNVQARIVICSSDHDIYQVLNKNTEIVNPDSRKIGKSFTWRKFFHKYGIMPSQWSEYKTINGCKSDEVPNIGTDTNYKRVFKVGHTKTLRYLRGELKKQDPFLQMVQSDFARKNIQRNRWLVKLPLEGTKPIKIHKCKLNLATLKKHFEKLQFNDFLIDRIDEWGYFCEDSQDRQKN